MKKILLLALSVTGVLYTNGAVASRVDHYITNDTCYVFKQNKLVTQSACQIYNQEAADGSFSYHAMKIPKVGVIKVVNNSSEYTVNGKKAISQYRDKSKVNKVLSEKQIQQVDESQRLDCDKSQDNKLEICKSALSTDNNFKTVDEPPKWAE